MTIKPVFDGGIVVYDSNGRAIGEVYPQMDGNNTSNMYGFLNYNSDLLLNHKSGLDWGGAGDGAW